MKHALVVGAALALGWAIPAHAVVLEQKWQEGQSLGYNMALDGSVNVQAPADLPVMWAGVPLEITLKGDGKAQLQTLKVDPEGNGTVTFKLPQMQLQFETFGMQGQWNWRNGASTLTIAGKPVEGAGKGMDLSALTNPNTAIQIGKDGRIRGFEPVAANAPADAAANAPANGAGAAATANPAGAVNQSAMVTAMVLQSLPALWPGRDVQQGETWQVNLSIPAGLLPAGATNGNEPKSLGTFNMTLKDSETEGKKTLWRVGVIGSIQLDGSQWNTTGTAQNPQQTNFKFDSARQSVEGDIWFDADAGQIARAELGLNSRAQGRTPKKGGGWNNPTWADFAGTLQLDLQPRARQ